MRVPDLNQPTQLSNARLISRYFKIRSPHDDNQPTVIRFLLGAVWAAVLVPALFYLHFGVIDWYAIAITIFFVVLSLLIALGLYFQTRTEYHAKARTSSSVADRIGGFWLVSCAFGPFFGWVITAFSPTESSWRWQYGVRAFLAIVLPLVTMLCLTGYARGKEALIAVPLLLGITMLPILSCWWVIGDLHDGAQMAQVTLVKNNVTGELVCQPTAVQYHLACDAARNTRAPGKYEVLLLAHTNRVIAVKPIATR